MSVSELVEPEKVGFNPQKVEINIKFKLVGHTSSVRSVVYFKNQNKLISSSFDGTLVHWDHKSGEMIRILGTRGGSKRVNQLVNWDDQDGILFYCCGSAIGNVDVKNMMPAEPLQYDYRRGIEIIRMMKCSNSSIIYITNEDEIHIIDEYRFNRPKPRKYHGLVTHHPLLKMILSVNYPSSFYVTGGYYIDHFAVKLIDYSKWAVSKTFRMSTHCITTIQVYNDKVNSEILICGGDEGILYFFNTVKGICIKRLEFSGPITSTFLLDELEIRRNVLFVGSGYIKGNVSVLDVYDNFKMLVKEKPIHRGAIYDFELLSKSSEEDIVEIVSCSNDKNVNILEVKNIYRERMEEYDLRERISFLWRFLDDLENQDKESYFVLTGYKFTVELSKLFFC